MKTDITTSSFYMTILATLLRDWREQNHITVYAVAKAINASPHTISRFEQFKGGVSLEVGLRYLEYAESHISNPCVYEKYRKLITQDKTQEEQRLYIAEQKRMEQLAKQREEKEQKQMEERIRKSISEEMQNKYNSDIRLLDDERQMLTDKIAQLEQENTALKNESRSTTKSKNTWMSKLKEAF